MKMCGMLGTDQWFLEVCSIQHHPHQLRTCQKYKLSGSIPEPLNQKLGECGPVIAILTNPPCDLFAYSSVRTIGQTQIKLLHVQKSEKCHYNFIFKPHQKSISSCHYLWSFWWKAEWSLSSSRQLLSGYLPSKAFYEFNSDSLCIRVASSITEK